MSTNGLAKSEFIACRVGKNPTWYPPHRNAKGKDVSSRLVIPLAVNDMFGNTEWVNVVAWGNKADSLAHTIGTGKEMHFFCRIKSASIPVKDNRGNIVYQAALGTEKDGQGNPVAAGTQIPIMRTVESHTVDDWLFGWESQSYQAWIDSQKEAMGKDNFKADFTRRKQLPYDGQSATYGRCKVGALAAGSTPLPHTRTTKEGGSITAGQVPAHLLQNVSMYGAGAASIKLSREGEVRVEGHTYKDYIGAGWTDEMMRKDLKFAPFFQAAGPGAPPPPPSQGVTGGYSGYAAGV